MMGALQRCIYQAQEMYYVCMYTDGGRRASIQVPRIKWECDARWVVGEKREKTRHQFTQFGWKKEGGGEGVEGGEWDLRGFPVTTDMNSAV